jgi:hypothetical protein
MEAIEGGFNIPEVGGWQAFVGVADADVLLGDEMDVGVVAGEGAAQLALVLVRGVALAPGRAPLLAQADKADVDAAHLVFGFGGTRAGTEAKVAEVRQQFLKGALALALLVFGVGVRDGIAVAEAAKSIEDKEDH